MERSFAGSTVSVNEEGYLTDAAQWTPPIAEALAAAAGIALTPRHWAVLEYLRREHAADAPLSIRRVGKSGVTDIKEFYQLFPVAPLKTASKIAGIPKPASCI